ncbi:MAG: electron transport complex subunit E [Pseudomonadota bacterium]
MNETAAQTLREGLWENNPGLVQLLGLCPLLAVTHTFVNGLGLGVATLFVLVCSNGLVSLTRSVVRDNFRIPIYAFIVASLVSCVELFYKAYFPYLDRSLGIFIPLIVTNCAIVVRAEVFASGNTVGRSLLDGAAMGLGFLALLCALGAFRELIGFGSVMTRLDMLFGGDAMPGLVLFDGGFLLAILPPGAFFGLAFAVAGKNYLDQRRRRSASFAARHRVT